MPLITANFAFQLQSLFLRCFRKFPLKRVLLSTVAFLLSAVLAFALCQGSPLSSLVKGNRVSLMLLTFRTVRSNFFRNVHTSRQQLCIKKTHILLYFFNNFLRPSRQCLQKTKTYRIKTGLTKPPEHPFSLLQSFLPNLA